MAMIVLTDFCCWCPIIILGLLAIFGVPISASVYSWIAVFILPVNSAVVGHLIKLVQLIERELIVNSIFCSTNLESDHLYTCSF